MLIVELRKKAAGLPPARSARRVNIVSPLELELLYAPRNHYAAPDATNK